MTIVVKIYEPYDQYLRDRVEHLRELVPSASGEITVDSVVEALIGLWFEEELGDGSSKDNSEHTEARGNDGRDNNGQGSSEARVSDRRRDSKAGEESLRSGTG